MKGKWIEIKVITSPDAIEMVSGIFYSLDVKGVAIEDPNDILQKLNTPSWDYVDMNLYEYGDKAAVVKGYFSDEDNIDEILKYINERLEELKSDGFDIGEGKILVNQVYEEDWATSWKKYYKVTKLGKRIVVKPRWEEYTPEDNEIVIELDPGMAFGTGTHETTILCLELLEKYLKGGETVFDIGTGSGILAIASSKFGAEKVVGVDIDEVAVDAARENVEYNNIGNVEIRHGNLTDVLTEKADIVVANIIADIIINMTSSIKNFIKQEGLFIVSGIIQDRKNDVLKELENNNLKIIEIKEMGEWVGIVSKPE
ncbi:Ribosomal protein L11 methyltransferase [Caloramator mitchellensis]|uniref:Ribosomal protein L11 methyltransferase n=1 Tax=Caloramator mitchellensis TaxID=908809 RepID=A0A0R3JT15_CALMK|nr:50S ribosomal protein L11 methyltransferase [Caloramator mitchellensis]KRQ86659.1 Ribosomal protein L11 methyltransferase [Caloramator mitchellensis]